MKTIFCIAFFISANAFAGYIGTVYEMGSNHKTPLYKFTSDDNGQPTRHVHSVYTDPSGAEAVVEDSWFENGKLVKYVEEQKQVDEKGSLVVKDGHAHLEYTKKGKTRTRDYTYTDDSMVTPSTIGFMQSHWQQLMHGEEVKGRFFALDRLNWYSFVFSKDGQQTVNGEKQVTIKMAPGNRIVAVIVDPIYFHFPLDGSRLRSFSGRVLPKRKSGNSWEDLDADTVYENSAK